MSQISLTRRICGDDLLRKVASSIIKYCDHNRVATEFLQACYVGLSSECRMRKIVKYIAEIIAGCHVGCCDDEFFDEIMCFLRPS